MKTLIKCIANSLSYTVKQIVACKVTLCLSGVIGAVACGAFAPIAAGVGIVVLGAICTSAKIMEQFWGNFVPMVVLLLLAISIWPLTGLYLIVESSIGALVYVLSGLILRSPVGYEVTVEMWAGLILVCAIPWIVVSAHIISIGFAWLIANAVLWTGIPIAWVYTQWAKVNKSCSASATAN